MNKRWKILTALLLISAMALNLTGCAVPQDGEPDIVTSKKHIELVYGIHQENKIRIDDPALVTQLENLIRNAGGEKEVVNDYLYGAPPILNVYEGEEKTVTFVLWNTTTYSTSLDHSQEGGYCIYHDDLSQLLDLLRQYYPQSIEGLFNRFYSKDLMADITPNKIVSLDDLSRQNAIVTDFAVRLFRAGERTGENTLISPLSVLCALAMTANGADGQTLQQMEDVFGMSVQDLNQYLYSYMKKLPQGEKYKLSLANSIWFTDDDRFTVRQEFLQTNADYYGADLYKAPFNNDTCRDINNWVNRNTDGMIPKILEQIPERAVMYLINALAFEAEWANVYDEYEVRDGIFTTEKGVRQEATFMYSEENHYLEDDSATGFIKYYKGHGYAFVALLPKEGVSVSDYIATLDGQSLNALLSAPRQTTVYASMPKFETEFSLELAGVLENMGMTDAFDNTAADLSKLGTSTDGNLFISRVLHKTFISLGELGTKAGAATSVEISDECAPIETKVVNLDRPFVYMLIDTQNNIPFFIGTMMNVEQ